MYLPISGVEIMGWKLILLGFTVGVIGGFFGIGGAFIVTPALNVFGFPMVYAIGTDMAQMAGKSIIATAKHSKFGNVDMKLGLIMIIGTVIGIELGATVIMCLENVGNADVDVVVRYVYMVLLFSLSGYMLYEYFKLTKEGAVENKTIFDVGKSALALKMQSIKLPPMVNLTVSGFTISIWVILSVATITGFVAGFLGVGGGFLRVPALIYVIGSPTRVAIGTDLFEIMISGAYGAFTYGIKGRVEIIAAVIMLIGASVGTQFGTLATQYVKGLKIRLYFAITMALAGVSVVLKTIAGIYKNIYSSDLNAWVKVQPQFLEWAQTEGIKLTTKVQVRDWILMNKEAVKGWFAQQSDLIQQTRVMETAWTNYSGYLMLGTAYALSGLIIIRMLQGINAERRRCIMP
ncbi:hypothetical protein COX18_00445 [Candidatus Desantisbacteria bacterium CG23_combo_of_CG06-09_8_20_14_all_40_23]|nr:MAG: hypothetical protein COX18_00445 [Candidatus Desantisbacteria bacterium CG23_combo_of_CG06-09_8_20_14_all_40_23]